MTTTIHFSGVIRIQPDMAAVLQPPADDDTLEALFDGLARRVSLAGNDLPRSGGNRIFTQRRSWPPAATLDIALSANLTRLRDELQAELDQIA
jgi:hypothetical protein